jgi:riboflavin kinase / FMN adenylyltransferase
LLAQGDLVRANTLLGRRYILSGPVVPGAGRGRTIDLPTANLTIPATRTVPGDGVYAALVPLDGRRRPAVVNIGGRPTFGDDERLIEVHILDFSGDLYGRRLAVEFESRLREVRKFGGVDELVAQIARDIAAARTIPALRAAADEPRRGVAEP